MQTTGTATTTAATATATAVRFVQSDDVLWSLHLEYIYTEVCDSASASTCTTLAAVLLQCGVYV